MQGNKPRHKVFHVSGIQKHNFPNSDELVSLYYEVFNSVESGSGLLFILDRLGAKVKTFLINFLIFFGAKPRIVRGIALVVEFSGFAETLLKDGKTNHSVFKFAPILIRVDTATWLKFSRSIHSSLEHHDIQGRS